MAKIKLRTRGSAHFILFIFISSYFFFIVIVVVEVLQFLTYTKQHIFVSVWAAEFFKDMLGCLTFLFFLFLFCSFRYISFAFFIWNDVYLFSFYTIFFRSSFSLTKEETMCVLVYCCSFVIWALMKKKEMMWKLFLTGINALEARFLWELWMQLALVFSCCSISISFTHLLSCFAVSSGIGWDAIFRPHID